MRMKLGFRLFANFLKIKAYEHMLDFIVLHYIECQSNNYIKYNVECI